ncbi:MAG: hypothetical protein JKY08_08610 [Flavobacteriaceae bacterium]|nr:hypothetical protein [Flavobacteriaceae bacterium]
MKKVYSILCLFIATAAFVSCSDDDDVALSSLNNITAFEINFEGIESDAITYDLGNSIAVSVPFGTTLEGLVATITVDALAEIVPASGMEVDYVDGVATVFTVTAEDGTIKTYPVTVNVRGEVGSGTQLGVYEIADLYGETAVYTYAYSDAKFVSEIEIVANDFGDITTTIVTFVFDGKNQVIGKNVVADNSAITYVYNELGVITTALIKKDEELTNTYSYEYDALTGELVTETRIDHTDADSVSVISFEYENGNVTTENRFGQVYTATYDDKNNPFKGIYPKAYSIINVGIHAVNNNNPATGTLADEAVIYEYNVDNFPVSAAYTYFGGFATVAKTYTYITE